MQKSEIACCKSYNSLGAKVQTDNAKQHNVQPKVVRLEVDDGEANAEENDQQKDQNGKARIEHCPKGKEIIVTRNIREQ